MWRVNFPWSMTTAMRIISPGWKSWENTAVLPESTNPIWNIVSAKAANPETNWNQQPWLTMSTDTPVTAGSEAVFFSVLMLYMDYGNIATVHFVHSNIAKIHSRLPAAMEFWLVCLGILAYLCQNTSRDSGVWTVTLFLQFNIAHSEIVLYNKIYLMIRADNFFIVHYLSEISICS